MTLFSPKTELFIDGAWVDVSGYVRYQSGVAITRGQADEQGELSPSQLQLTLNNIDGRFSNRNPLSPYYGLLGRNTAIRQSVTGFPFHLRNDGAGYATTPDAAALDITGDLDIRVDLEPDSWRPAARQVIASKSDFAGNQRGWYLSLTSSGGLEFAWSTAGTAYIGTTSSAIPSTTRRLTVRVVLDVVSGANHTVTFYTGDSVTTATTQLGSVYTGVGNTSIFSNTAVLDVGAAGVGSVIFAGDVQLLGRVYRMQLRNSAGTVVADPDFTAQTVDTASFSDTFRTWTVVSPARITSDGIRLVGEVPTWPTRWDLSGRDVYTPIEAAGITRRLTQGASPLRSPIYRNLAQYDSSITLGWWPFEDESESESAASAVSGGLSAAVTGITFAADDTLPGATAVATIDATTSRISGTIRRTLSGSATGWSALIYFKMPAIPGADNQLIGWTSAGTIATWQIIVGTATYNLLGYDTTGTLLVNLTTLFGSGAEPNQWIAMQAKSSVSGGTVTITLDWHAVGTGIFFGNSTTYAGSPGTPRGWSLIGQAALVGASVAHVYFGENTLPFVSSDFAASSNGYRGETAVARLRRLCGEEGVNLFVHYVAVDESTPMGRQGISTFVELITECRDADLGVLYETRDQFGYGYWPLTAIYNASGPSFDYGTHIADPFEPVDDDQQVHNAVIANRPGGSSATAEQEDGPLSILAPPDGVGRYEATFDVNAYTDDQLPDLAHWLLHLGTFDALRYPAISFKLGNSAFTASASATTDVARLDLGRRFTVDSLPAWLPPDPALSLVQGAAETLSTDTWDITTSTTPAGLHDVGVLDDDDARLDTDGCELAEALDTTEAGVDVTTTSGPVWAPTSLLPAEVPFSIMVGGELMTVTNVSGTGAAQTLTVTRSVNGIVKTHAIGADVRLAYPMIIAL